ncbi:MAG: uroporphyrinogen decarboxylase family protein [Planctomycetota bacterium]|jgi:uroporphyrinogen decarboxylase
MALDDNANPPRAGVDNRYYRTFTYQDVGRVPDVEFGYWPQTARRWLAEGMKADLSENEIQGMFGSWMDEHFGFDQEPSCGLNLRLHINPVFEEELIEQRERSAIRKFSSGVTAEVFEGDVEESSIPHFLEFPVKCPEDWADMKARHNRDDPIRTIPQEEIDAARAATAEGTMMVLAIMGPYAKLRDMMGFENACVAFYEYPEMVHDMLDHWTAMMLDQIAQFPDDVAVDSVQWWEDMASKNGPFVSPTMFREFLQPCYHEIMTEAKRRGCAIGMVDCDGDPHDIVANWLEEGVSIMFPLEVAAGVDPYAWREEFGMELRLRGGVAKAPLVEGGKAIDKEMERLKPLLEQGGFIPHLDHLVPPDISYSNYCYYVEKKRELIGK